MGFIKRHWPALFAVGANLPAMWRSLVWLFDWEERIEAFTAKFHAYGGLAGLMQFFVNPPPWLIWVTLPTGFAIIWWDIKRQATSKDDLPHGPLAATSSELLPDISARDPYYRILEGSVWKAEQLRATTDTSNLRRDWLEFRLRTEIHKALRNARLAAWGEECLHGMVTTPEKPIPPEAWDRIELEFDSNPNLPRTPAYFKGPTTFQRGKMAWIGVKFNEAQIFSLFPLGLPAQQFRAMWEAIAHVARCIGDDDFGKFWPKARLAIRQGALDKKIGIRGRKSAEFMAAGLRWSEVETDIPSGYWENADINEMATAKDAPSLTMQTFPHRYSDGRFGSDKIFLYAQLRVSWEDIIKEWSSY